MILPSRLSATTLGDLLGMLHRERTTGTLELTELWLTPGTRSGHHIHLHSGLVTGVDTSITPGPRLGELLWREGFLSNSSYRILMAHLGNNDSRPTGEILVAERLADAVVVEAALRVQVRMKLDALFELGDAFITFHTARPLHRTARRIHPLTTKDFLIGRPRARDGVPTSEVRPRTRPAAWTQPFASCAAANESSRPKTTPPPPSYGPRSSQSTSQSEAPKSSGHAKPSSRFLHLAPDVRQRALGKLGLPPTADETDVKRAFRKLAVELHPDKHATAATHHRDRNAAKFAEVSEAYHLLVA